MYILQLAHLDHGVGAGVEVHAQHPLGELLRGQVQVGAWDSQVGYTRGGIGTIWSRNRQNFYNYLQF